MILGERMNAKYQCWQCQLLLKNPVQSYCGHRLCNDCMLYLMRTNPGVRCQLCVEEDTVGEESYLNRTFLDNAVRREMSKLSVCCSIEGCTWTGFFKNYDEHELAVHTTEHLCPFGCGEQVESANLASHAVERLDRHLDAVSTRISTLEGVLHEVLHGQAPVDRSVTAVETAMDVTRASDASPLTASSGGTAAAGGDIQPVSVLSEKITIYEGVITVLNREVEKLSTKMEALERQHMLERNLMDGKVRTLERLLATNDATRAELELRVKSVEQTSYNGILLWCITDFQRKRQDAISGRHISIYSPPFFSNKTGYKMCARLYLNGDGIGKNTHVSLFFVLMRGAYDALLKWPFGQKVTLMFIDHNGKERASNTFRPDSTNASFKRPTTEMNIATGYPQLLPLTELDVPDNSYVKDNVAFVKVTVN